MKKKSEQLISGGEGEGGRLFDSAEYRDIFIYMRTHKQTRTKKRKKGKNSHTHIHAYKAVNYALRREEEPPHISRP